MFHVNLFGKFCSKISYMNKFSIHLKELRHEKNETRKELAEILNVSVRTISYWELGKRECGFDMLIMIAKHFNVSIDYLLGITIE